jgi:hypothetical protein
MPIPTLVSSDLPAPRRYDPAHVVWFFAAITTGFMTFAVLDTVDSGQRGTWQLLAALGVIFAYLAVAVVLVRRRAWVPAGLLATVAVWIVPFAGVAFERLVGVGPDGAAVALGRDVQWAAFALVIVTALAGLAVYAAFRFPFVLLTVTWAVVVAAELLSPLWSGNDGYFDDTDAFVPYFASPAWAAVNTALVTGILLLLVGVVLDARRARDAAFWWHVVGLLAIAAGLAAHGGAGHTWAWIVMFAAAGALLVLSTTVGRATWATFGVLGVYAAAFHFVVRWFSEWWEPFVLGIISLALLGVGIALAQAGARWPRPTPPHGTPPDDAPPAETPPPAATPPDDAPAAS